MERNYVSSLRWIIVLYSFITVVHCDCGAPPQILYGMLKPEFAGQMTFDVGSTVKYDCNPGYVRVSGAKNYVICLENSKWSPIEDFCRLRSCGFPGEVENGYFEAENFFFGSRVTYHCDVGYHIISKRSYRVCQADGTWSNSLPVCQGVMCPPPPTIPNGTFYPVKEEYYYLDAVKYECNNPKMVMENDSTLFCMDNGHWNNPEPRCIEVNCKPPNVPHSRKLSGFVGPYSLNSLITFECTEGFTMRGSTTVVCDMDSIWKPLLPECIEAFCPEPELLHGKVIAEKKTDGYKVRDSVSLVCDSYYVLNGASKVTCGKDFQWYPTLPTCELGTLCPAYKLINGSILRWKETTGYNKHDSITLDCDTGYKIKGAKKLKCEKNFQWSGKFPICELENGCSSPQIANGRVTRKNGIHYDPKIDGHGFSTADEIEITCDSSYRLRGSSQSKCVYKRIPYWITYHYDWSPELPKCQN